MASSDLITWNILKYKIDTCYTMGGFEKNCPVCGKKFTSLIEYTNHIGVDHKDIPPEQILKINKEDKWSFSNK
ncbi:hypothetical protein [Candidatus Nitrosotalea okcheonensis]|uniref:C2H2-type domain-containing protein n=1 Tax=Candidatus Nitrosotalea okcheonensis TaxID=1903276 RepID=A0A2H1FCL0_9ARCH|nr:hypothetical protein [Candidatus Nitrosotalea okcheonensis]MDE1728335.1 hypothetical protein [Nitrososphaerota archaeon]MDE1831054.1 hypothetical protein [Nitrososphaerota archaeon]MDE1840917.1 hypothetical protein [Nitrososphaerota archaeon]MDE1877272.1 hypothetical protein [Nitrososphaerota archaeon]SMH70491.1 conserved protein of unknown function [Candidatus Nitrosotalea okcheonensis]